MNGGAGADELAADDEVTCFGGAGTGPALAASGSFSLLASSFGFGGAFVPQVSSFTGKVKSPCGTMISPVLRALMYRASWFSWMTLRSST